MKTKEKTIRVMLLRPILQPSEDGPRHCEPGEILELPESLALRLLGTASPKALPYETDEQQKVANDRHGARIRLAEAKAEAAAKGKGDDDALFECDFCEKTYKTESGIERHIAKEHPDD